jgi:hypothetical protein
MRRHKNAPLSPKGRELSSSRRSWWRPAQGRRAPHILNKDYAAIFRPLLTLARCVSSAVSLEHDAQVELGYEFSFPARQPSRQYAFNRAIMPCMSIIFEGLRGGARQPMLTLTAPVFWLSGLRRTSWSPPNELVSAAPTK